MTMDPYSAKRHGLYQPRGPTEYDFEYVANPDIQQIQQIEESNTSWCGRSLAIEIPENIQESHDGSIPFLPAIQSAKRIRIEAEESSVPMDVRSEVFALLSVATLDEFLEIRQFLKRPNHSPASGSKFETSSSDCTAIDVILGGGGGSEVAMGASAIFSAEGPTNRRGHSSSRSVSMPPPRNHWPGRTAPSQIGMESSIFGSRHDSSPPTFHSAGQLSMVAPEPNLQPAGLNYLSEDLMLLPTDSMIPNIPASAPSLTSNFVPYLDETAGTGPIRDFSRRRGIYWVGSVDSKRDSTISRSSTSSMYTDRSISSKHSSTSTITSQGPHLSGMPMSRPPTLSSAAIKSMAQFADLYPHPHLSVRAASTPSNTQIPCDFPPCAETFGRKADRDRHHGQFHIPETLFTCLLDTCTSECEDPCTEKFHNAPCRKTRADKMKRHLASSHGLDIKQSEIPGSWRRCYLHSSNGWTCGFCNEFLGTWSDNEDVINGHFESCMLHETRSTLDIPEQGESTKELDAGNDLNNSLKRLSVQEKLENDET